MRRTPFFVSVVAVLTLLSGTQVRAESIVWNWTDVDDFVCSTGGDGYRLCDLSLRNMNFSIQYHVQALKIDNNDAVIAPIACGSTVNAGERVRFEFIPHVYQDISWFGTGSFMDSPYGDWVVGAAGPTLGCYPKDYVGAYPAPDGRLTALFYAPLSVDPPQKSIVEAPGYTCTGNATSKICSASASGTFGVQFVFAPTIGKFYQRLADTKRHSKSQLDANPLACLDHEESHNVPMISLTPDAQQIFFSSANGGVFTQTLQQQGTYTAALARTFVLNVPQQVISCPITVVGGDMQQNPGDSGNTDGDSSGSGGNQSPGGLSITGGVGGSTGNQCIIGTPFTLTVAAIDPDGDKVRYLIDWDNNGSIDQFVPASGFVDSGIPQTVSRTFTLAGGKTVGVRAEDESGATSGWTTFSFTCNAPATNVNTTPHHDQNDQNNAPQDAILDLRAIPSIVAQNKTTHIHWLASGVVSCTVTAPTGDAWSGLESVVGGEETSPITTSTTYTLSCRDTGGEIRTKTVRVSIVPQFSEL